MAFSLKKFASADLAVHYCYRNIDTSKEKLHSLVHLRSEIYRIIRLKVQSDDNYLLSNLNLNICVDGKITMCQIGNGGILLVICIVGNRTVYEWIDGSGIKREGSSLKKFTCADLAVHYCFRCNDTSKEKLHILKQLRTEIYRIIRFKVQSVNDNCLLTNFYLKICVDGNFTMCQIGHGGILLVICIDGNRAVHNWMDGSGINREGLSSKTFTCADEAVHYCYQNMNTSKKKKRILALLRCGIYEIVREMNFEHLFKNINLNICLDGKRTMCQIGNGGILLVICIVGNRTVYEWMDGSGINGEFVSNDNEQLKQR